MLINLKVSLKVNIRLGRIWGGSARRWNPLGSTRGSGKPPGDIGQKKCLNCLFVKLKVGNIYYFNVNNYQILSVSLMHIAYNLYSYILMTLGTPLHPLKRPLGVPNGFQGVKTKFGALHVLLKNRNPCQFL